MYCLRDFDMVAALEKPSLFRLYGEIPYAIANGFTVEKQVKQHIINSNYGHQGNPKSAHLYGWEDLSNLLVHPPRFEHEMLHVCLAIVCEEEGWNPFMADGNVIGEAMVQALEWRFRFWSENSDITDEGFETYLKLAEDFCWGSKQKANSSFINAWLAAGQSDRPMTAFEARFLGVLPKGINMVDSYQAGDVNKCGEVIPYFEINREHLEIFYRKMERLRLRMMETIKETPYGLDVRDVCQAFFKTLRVDEIAEITSGRNPDQKLSFDFSRLKTAYMNCYPPPMAQQRPTFANSQA